MIKSLRVSAADGANIPETSLEEIAFSLPAVKKSTFGVIETPVLKIEPIEYDAIPPLHFQAIHFVFSAALSRK